MGSLKTAGRERPRMGEGLIWRNGFRLTKKSTVAGKSKGHTDKRSIVISSLNKVQEGGGGGERGKVALLKGRKRADHGIIGVTNKKKNER